jgi:hypothetical protein
MEKDETPNLQKILDKLDTAITGLIFLREELCRFREGER